MPAREPLYRRRMARATEEVLTLDEDVLVRCLCEPEERRASKLFRLRKHGPVTTPPGLGLTSVFPSTICFFVGYEQLHIYRTFDR